MSDEEMLQHYGLLGMKWGVRRTPAQLTRANGRAGKTESSDEIKKMSDSNIGQIQKCLSRQLRLNEDTRIVL